MRLIYTQRINATMGLFLKEKIFLIFQLIYIEYQISIIYKLITVGTRVIPKFRFLPYVKRAKFNSLSVFHKVKYYFLNFQLMHSIQILHLMFYVSKVRFLFFKGFNRRATIIQTIGITYMGL